MRRFVFCLVYLLATLSITAQGLNEYISFAVEKAWAFQQANLHVYQAEANLLGARAAFDPQLSLLDRGKAAGAGTGYRYQEAEVRLPLVGGMALNATGQWGSGPWLNPESRLPLSGLAGLGLSVPVGPQLWYSESQQKVNVAQREVAVAKAELYVIEQEVAKEALQRFVAWSVARREREVYTASLARLEAQLAQIRASYSLGASARKDTLELFAYKVMRQSQFLQALQSEQAALQVLQSFLGPEGAGRQWQALAFEDPFYQFVGLRGNPALEQAPKRQLWEAKQNQARTQLRFEQMQRWNAPNVNVIGWQYADSFNPYGSSWKVAWDIPGFNRKNRSERQLASLYLQEMTLGQDFFDQEALNREVQWSQQWPTSLANVQTMYTQAATYRELWELEEQSFALGYSSVFMKNQRELAYLDALINRNQAVAAHLQLLAEWAAFTGQQVQWP
ncbi:MAG: TolC family protein [Schleiferiaceae bacterium]|nr:TolC family protein [Schleiferiaceae bacterium]